MRLDHRAYIFQNLNGAQDEVELELQKNETYLHNSIYDTRAAVYHGNGPSKVDIMSRYHNANYIIICVCDFRPLLTDYMP